MNSLTECQPTLNSLVKHLSANKASVVPTVFESQPEIQTDEEIYRIASSATNAQKFNELWAGNWQNKYPSQSEADLAICNIIGYYTNNEQQVLRLFLRSALGKREKATRLDYQQWLINKAFDQKVPLVEGVRNFAVTTPGQPNPFALAFDINNCDLDSIPHPLDFPPVEIQFAVKNMIAESAITALTGASGCGKTTLLGALIQSATTGSPFLDQETIQRKVLYIDAENSLPIVQERFRRLHISPSPNLIYIGQHLDAGFPSLDSASVVSWVQKHTPKPLVIVDSYAAFFNGDESSTKDIRAYFRRLDKIKTLGAAIVFIHHTGKGESTKPYRGGTAFKDSIDVMYEMTNTGEGKLEQLKLKAEKQRFTVKNEIDFAYDKRRLCRRSQIERHSFTQRLLLSEVEESLKRE